MNKTSEKCMTVGMLIREFQALQEKLGGDPEVVIFNSTEKCFDGVGNLMVLTAMRNSETFIALIRSNVVIKP